MYNVTSYNLPQVKESITSLFDSLTQLDSSIDLSRLDHLVKFHTLPNTSYLDVVHEVAEDLHLTIHVTTHDN